MKISVICVLLVLGGTRIKAQTSANHKISGDSSMALFRNSIYNTINSPAFKSKNYEATFTVLKIDIDKMGRVKEIKFSDSADTLFTKAYANRSGRDNEDKIDIEKFAKAKGYSSISIIVPISYEPFYTKRRSFYYDNMEALMKFNKGDFVGPAIILPPIRVKVSERGNM